MLTRQQADKPARPRAGWSRGRCRADLGRPRGGADLRRARGGSDQSLLCGATGARRAATASGKPGQIWMHPAYTLLENLTDDAIAYSAM